MKFYAITLVHNKTGKKIRKFGLTSKYDIVERFNPKYKNNSHYNEFTIKPDFSWNLNDNDAQKLEHEFIFRYPKNFYLESYLCLPYNHFDDFSGITELVIIDDPEWKNILKELYYRKNNGITE
jgi:hypothetical protein